jgi:hypothetical protein
MAGNEFWRLVALIEEACGLKVIPAAPVPPPPTPVPPAPRVWRYNKRACLPLDYKNPARLSRQGRLEASKARDDADRAAAMVSAVPTRGTPHAR